MSLPWPSYWQHIPPEERPAFSDILTDLLAHGALVGDIGRDRELFLLAREYQRELAEYLAPLNLELLSDPDRPILQVRPVPGKCGLLSRFNKAETLLVLTLWRMYDDARMERPVESVITTVNDVWQRLRLYFEHIEPPAPAHLREMLGRLRNRRFVRLRADSDSENFSDWQVEILPTLARAIPFENSEMWEQQAALYSQTHTSVLEKEKELEQ